MQASASAQKQSKRSAFAGNLGFFVHASLLGGFIGLVGYLTVVCHHVH